MTRIQNMNYTNGFTLLATRIIISIENSLHDNKKYSLKILQ
jgi:hypothetical protein